MKTMTKPTESTWVDGRGVPGDPGFSNSYDFDFVDGEIVDKQGTKNLAITGVPVRAKDPFLKTRTTMGPGNYGSVAAHPVMASTTQTFEFSIYPTDPTAVLLQGLITNGSTGADTQRLVIGSNRINYSYYVGGVFIAMGAGVGPVLSTDPQVYHIVVTRDYDGTTTTGNLYFNGVLVQSFPYLGAPNVTNQNLFLGYLNADRSFDGDFYGPVNMYTVAKDAAWVQKRYLEKAKAIQFRTTDGIKTSTGTGQTGGLVGGNSPFEVQSGTWSIDYNTVLTEDIAKVLTCDAAGSVSLRSRDFKANPSENAYGTWNFWLKKADASNTVIWWGDQTSPYTTLDGYRLILATTEDLAFSRMTAGAATTLAQTGPSVIIPTVWTYYTLTRRYDGQWSLYRNGTLLTALIGTNPVTDNTHKALEYLSFDLDAGDQIAVSGKVNAGPIWEYTVNKRLGVVAP